MLNTQRKVNRKMREYNKVKKAIQEYRNGLTSGINNDFVAGQIFSELNFVEKMFDECHKHQLSVKTP